MQNPRCAKSERPRNSERAEMRLRYYRVERISISITRVEENAHGELSQIRERKHLSAGDGRAKIAAASRGSRTKNKKERKLMRKKYK
jgi:hypothetical protein